MGHQRNQRVEGSRADFNRDAIFRKDSFTCDQAERTKLYDVSGLRRRACHGLLIPRRLTGQHSSSRTRPAPEDAPPARDSARLLTFANSFS